MLTCREITQMSSQGQKLSKLRRLEIHMHQLMCKHCRNYAKHLELLGQAFRRLWKKRTSVSPDAIRRLEDESLKGFKSDD